MMILKPCLDRIVAIGSDEIIPNRGVYTYLPTIGGRYDRSGTRVGETQKGCMSDTWDSGRSQLEGMIWKNPL